MNGVGVARHGLILSEGGATRLRKVFKCPLGFRDIILNLKWPPKLWRMWLLESSVWERTDLVPQTSPSILWYPLCGGFLNHRRCFGRSSPRSCTRRLGRSRIQYRDYLNPLLWRWDQMSASLALPESIGPPRHRSHLHIQSNQWARVKNYSAFGWCPGPMRPVYLNFKVPPDFTCWF